MIIAIVMIALTVLAWCYTRMWGFYETPGAERSLDILSDTVAIETAYDRDNPFVLGSLSTLLEAKAESDFRCWWKPTRENIVHYDPQHFE